MRVCQRLCLPSYVCLRVCLRLCLFMHICVYLCLCMTMCMYLYIFVWVCLYLYLYTHICMCMCVCICAYVCLSVSMCVNVCLCVCLCLCLCTHVCMSVSIPVPEFVCAYVCVSVYVLVFVHAYVCMCLLVCMYWVGASPVQQWYMRVCHHPQLSAVGAEDLNSGPHVQQALYHRAILPSLLQRLSEHLHLLLLGPAVCVTLSRSVHLLDYFAFLCTMGIWHWVQGHITSSYLSMKRISWHILSVQ